MIYGLGAFRQQPDARDYILSVDAAPALQGHADLRPHMPPIQDQGQRGACTAFSSTAAYWYTYTKLGYHHPFEPSEEFQYWNSRGYDGDQGSDSGSSNRAALKALARFGVCAEHWFPYSEAVNVKPNAYAYANAIKHTATSYWSLPQDATAFKASLDAGWPIVVGIMAYRGIMSPDAIATGVVPMPSPGEQTLGGHSILLVGYDDATGTWLLRNSWGVGYGMAGYFTLPHAYLLDPLLSFDWWTLRKAS